MERNLKYPLLVLRRDADFQFYCPFAHCFLVPPPSQIQSVSFDFQYRAANQIFKKWPDTGCKILCPAYIRVSVTVSSGVIFCHHH